MSQPVLPSSDSKKLSIWKAFTERLEAQGRGKELKDTIKLVQQETGKGFGQARLEAFKRMGYTDSKTEWPIYYKFLEDQELAKKKDTLKTVRAEIREERKAENYEEAVKTLPDKAAVQVEIDWIRAHPAMSRLNRQTDKTKYITLTVDDVLCPPHGRAPSKSSVNALQHWCNIPNKFFEMILSEHKKASEDEVEKKKAATDVGIPDIEQMLAEISDGLENTAS